MAFWRLVSMVLTVLLVCQWILFSMVLSHRHDPTLSAERTMIRSEAPPIVQPPEVPQGSPPKEDYDPAPPTDGGGVAVTVMLKAPKWFHRRYTAMLHNILANIPDTWKVQIFVNTAWLEKEVLLLHPGLRSMYHGHGHGHGHEGSNKNQETAWEVGRVTWIALPANMTRSKPKEIMKSTWFWESVMAENVLLFGGNGALCANSQSPLSDFFEFDYVGTPWPQYEGKGGDGSTHSFRHRSAMLSILQKYPPDHDDRPDFRYFIQHLLEESSQKTMKVADRKTTMAFGGVSEADKAPFLLSGIQASLNWTMRDNILSTCPEIKVIFPSMHEPSCFGAHPNGAKCKESICALRDEIPPGGC
jgi:hypothetical protein